MLKLLLGTCMFSSLLSFLCLSLSSFIDMMITVVDYCLEHNITFKEFTREFFKKFLFFMLCCYIEVLIIFFAKNILL